MGLLVGGAVDDRLQQAAHFVLEDATFMSLVVANVERRHIIVVELIGVGRLFKFIDSFNLNLCKFRVLGD